MLGMVRRHRKSKSWKSGALCTFRVRVRFLLPAPVSSAALAGWCRGGNFFFQEVTVSPVGG